MAVAGWFVLNAVGRSTDRIFLASLAVLLVGFLFQSKAFSYIGLPPLFISEIVLLLGLAALAFTGVRWRFTTIHIWLFVFMGLGLARTLPYVSLHGLDAIRDAAQWYYGLFAVLVSLFLTRDRIAAFLRLYARILPILTVWLLMMPFVVRLVPASLPRLPGSPFPIVYSIKPGDRGVILAGIGVFVAAGLYQRFSRRPIMPTSAVWTCWIGAAGFVAIANRGGMVAMATALVMVAIVNPSREVLKASIISVSLLAILIVVNPTIDIGGSRPFSVDQLWTNVTSVFSDETEDAGGVQGTKSWRLDWWADIYQDTVHGPHFWDGHGFGVNLTIEYGTQAEESLRSPHNGHMTILARMGVPGILAWALLLISFLWQMLRSFRMARKQGQEWAGVIIWLLAMWLAALVNASFDVYLESPYGAIPFFCVMGGGIAVMRFQREDALQETLRGSGVQGSPGLHAHSSRP
jgi:hypothetical protein